MQRGRPYAELARWLGQTIDEEYPGLVVVGTITTDFAAEILDEKHDQDYVVPRLQARGTEEFNLLAARAEVGMRLIKGSGIPLERPDEASLESTYAKLKEIHSKAYDWTAPDVPSGYQRTTRRMRSHVRRWINEWDLRRLYPTADIDLEEQDIIMSYGEDKDLEESSANDAD